ncbi:TPA: hypothetical protein DF272_00115 [Candidatus Falkowbacteria bacterium]|nr:hypothetical protein [Candidatus Falkowbacteria bacterium]
MSNRNHHWLFVIAFVATIICCVVCFIKSATFSSRFDDIVSEIVKCDSVNDLQAQAHALRRNIIDYNLESYDASYTFAALAAVKGADDLPALNMKDLADHGQFIIARSRFESLDSIGFSLMFAQYGWWLGLICLVLWLIAMVINFKSGGGAFIEAADWVADLDLFDD